MQMNRTSFRQYCYADPGPLLNNNVCPFLESLVMIYMFSCHNFMTIQVTMTTTQFKCDKRIYWIKGPGQSSGNYIAINEEGIKELPDE